MFMRIQVIHAIFHISRTFRTIAELQVRIVLLGTSADRAFVAGQGNFLDLRFLHLVFELLLADCLFRADLPVVTRHQEENDKIEHRNNNLNFRDNATR